MARIQVLELPMEHHGEDTVTPFALVIDQATGEEEQLFLKGSNTMDAFTNRCGARAALVVAGTLDVA